MPSALRRWRLNTYGIGSIAVYGLVCLLSWINIETAPRVESGTPIGAPEAVLLVCLLRVPQRFFGLYIIAGVLGYATANILVVPYSISTFSLAIISTACPAAAAFLLNRSGRRIDLTRRIDLLKFFTAAGIIGPALSTILILPYTYYFFGMRNYYYQGAGWFLQHALGCIIITPALLVISRASLRHAWEPERRWALITGLLVVAATTVLSFSFEGYKLLFLIFPALIMATFRGGFIGAALGTLLIGLISSLMILAGHGLAAATPGALADRMLILQIFLVLVFLTSLPIAATLAEIDKSEQETIVARRDLEEQNRLLQLAEQTAHVGHWRLNLENSALFWSDETYRIYGRDKNNYDLNLDSVRSSYHPEDHDAVRECADVIARIIRPDGELRYIRSYRQPELDTASKAKMVFGVAYDITDIKRTELALIGALEEATRANQAKSDFLASMSHELRTPLNAVIGFSEILLNEPKGSLSAIQTEYIGYVLRGGKHLLQLVADVLDLATIESGRLRVKIETIDLGRVLKEAESFLKPIAEEKKLTLAPTALPDGPLPPIRADHGRLLQILLNLGSNAIKYNRPGGSLGINVTLIDDRKLRISVTDTGNGIPVNRQTELFEPFNRLGAENGAIEGTGIGLNICRQLMGLMGGTIDYTSTPGVGSVFWIEIQFA